MNPDYLSRKIEKMTGDKFATRLIADRFNDRLPSADDRPHPKNDKAG